MEIPTSSLCPMDIVSQSPNSYQEDILSLYCAIDDICVQNKHVGRKPSLRLSESLTIALLRYVWGFSNWKDTYTHNPLSQKGLSRGWHI